MAPAATLLRRPVRPRPRSKSVRRSLRRKLSGRLRLGVELQHGVDAAAALGGTAEAAIMLDGWRTPIIASSEARGEARFMRMWSMSKVATMVAVLRGLGWGRRGGRPISPELDEALHGAITRSENCRQRRVVLELQRLSGGVTDAREALPGRLPRRRRRGRRRHTGSATPKKLHRVPSARRRTWRNPSHLHFIGTSTWRMGTRCGWFTRSR